MDDLQMKLWYIAQLGVVASMVALIKPRWFFLPNRLWSAGAFVGLLALASVLQPQELRDQQNGAAQHEADASDNEAEKGSRGLSFRIVEEERQMKGGSLQPLRSPGYVLLVVQAVLTEVHQELTEANVKASLMELVESVREDNPDIDGITAFLYQSRDHLDGGNPALGRAEWWPRGHSFNPENDANVENKTTYVESVEVFSLPDSMQSVASRLTESDRREIFAALVRSEDRARREADAKYPTDASKIPMEDLSTYDWLDVGSKNLDESDRLREKYQKELIQAFGISETELEQIKQEAFVEDWPLPPLR
jgi:hypothetical protein